MEILNNVIKLAEKDPDVLAVLLFGSASRNEPNRDIDICLVLNKKRDNLAMSKIKLKYSSLSPDKIDFQIFQQIPIYIRHRILKEGKILHCKNNDALYSIAVITANEFERYKKFYFEYLESLKYGAG